MSDTGFSARLVPLTAYLGGIRLSGGRLSPA